ncbi:hypothetical protein [Azospirillum sp. B4]|uniref:hypothetical protein n=1 Tax=Azospirillum sp. B4 TaxID=95605 RepID=UPI0011DD9F74|nr:hypothetical protein [Azospirillum sp. B4]
MDDWQRRYRLSNGPGGLGVSCTTEGLALAGVPLVVKGAGGFRVRPAAEVGRLLRRAYAGAEPRAAVLSGLSKIADALNRGDLTHAMIRAVHLRLPELDWDAAVRLARADDSLAKYGPDQPRDCDGCWTTEGGKAADGPAGNTPKASTQRGLKNKPHAVSGKKSQNDAEDARRGKVNCGTGAERIGHDSMNIIVTFDGMKIDQPINPELASVVNSIGSIPGVESFNISSTTGGHKDSDPHIFGNAVDINKINGVHVGDPSISELVSRVQNHAMNFERVYSSLGPSGIYVRDARNRFADISPQRPDLVREHSNHIHIGVGCP